MTASVARPVPARADLAARVRRRLVADGVPASRAGVVSAVSGVGVLGGAAVLGAAAEVADELVGLGPLTPLLSDDEVTDVVVTGPEEVWCDRGDGLRRVSLRFRDDASVRALAQRLVAQAGRRLDDSLPYADVALPGGVRVHAVLPPIAVDGAQLSIRVPRERRPSLGDLVAWGAASAEMAGLLTEVVRRRLAFLVTGGTGAGKTTLLAALLSAGDPSDRVLLVEEIPELRPALPHVVRLQARAANAEGAGEVTLSDLVRQTLRMRPDRLVVGEVRGAEVVDLLRALNSGHEGGCGTVHANGIADLPARVEALAACAGLPRPAAHSLLAAAVRVVVHLDRDATGRRRVAAVGVLEQGPDGLVRPSVAAAPPDTRSPTASRPPGAATLRRLLAERGGSWPL